MANTKHSAAREIIIDRLLRQRRGYSLYEMLDTVNQELEQNGFRHVTLNTIRNDIENFRYLYRQKVEVELRSYRNYYRYEDPNASIFNNVLTFGEMQHIHAALVSIRFVDAVQGTLMYKQLSKRLCGILQLDTEDDPILIYEQKHTINDLRRFQAIYDIVRKKAPTFITYKKDEADSPCEILVHPYFLRQKGENWNLLCHDATNNVAAEIPISSITRLASADDVEFIPNKDFSFKKYFKKASVA